MTMTSGSSSAEYPDGSPVGPITVTAKAARIVALPPTAPTRPKVEDSQIAGNTHSRPIPDLGSASRMRVIARMSATGTAVSHHALIRFHGTMTAAPVAMKTSTMPAKNSGIPDAAGDINFHVVVLSDITEQKRAEQELRYLANYDALTSLPNRSLLSERLARAIVRARREGGHVAVLFLDLDRFKDVNDSLGHATGDRVLRAAAERVQHAVGPQHTVARLGGDEFTVVLEGLAAPGEAEDVARRVIEAFLFFLFRRLAIADPDFALHGFLPSRSGEQARDHLRSGFESHSRARVIRSTAAPDLRRGWLGNAPSASRR